MQYAMPIGTLLSVFKQAQIEKGICHKNKGGPCIEPPLPEYWYTLVLLATLEAAEVYAVHHGVASHVPEVNEIVLELVEQAVSYSDVANPYIVGVGAAQPMCLERGMGMIIKQSSYFRIYNFLHMWRKPSIRLLKTFCGHCFHFCVLSSQNSSILNPYHPFL